MFLFSVMGKLYCWEFDLHCSGSVGLYDYRYTNFSIVMLFWLYLRCGILLQTVEYYKLMITIKS